MGHDGLLPGGWVSISKWAMQRPLSAASVTQVWGSKGGHFLGPSGVKVLAKSFGLPKEELQDLFPERAKYCALVRAPEPMVVIAASSAKFDDAARRRPSSTVSLVK